MDWKLVKATRQRFTGEVHANRERLGIERQIRGFEVRNHHPRLASSH
jgi:hypothetical protein